MGDFAQEGDICTLQRLAETPLLERDLYTLARERPIALILPCHSSDFGQPALGRIRDELAGADWLSEIVFSINGFDAATARRATGYFSSLPQRVRTVWNDEPALQSTFATLLECSAAQIPAGKGFNVWSAIGLLSATTRPAIIAIQDCDVKTFRRSSLARLCFPCAEPELNFSLAKMYYPRVTDRLYGRVTRLFLAPLLRALTTVIGPEPLLCFLRSFRYPLAGEIAIRTSLASRLSLPSGWALEISTLCEVFREVDPHVICQVDGGDKYDHKHQLQVEALTGMCQAIWQSLIPHLEAAGVECQASAYGRIREELALESHEAIRRYAALARMNGLPFDAPIEEALAQDFAAAINPGQPSLDRTLPSWEGLLHRHPVAVQALVGAAGAAQK